MRRLFALAGVLAALGAGGRGALGCASEPGVTSGLERTALVELPWDSSGTPHATRLLTDATDRAWILDSNLSISVRLPSLAVDLKSEETVGLRCTVGALGHGRVYCGSPDSKFLPVYDATTGRKLWPDAPLSRAITPGAFDLALGGANKLYAATAGVGLERLDLGADGLPIEASRVTLVAGDLEALAGDGGDRLAAMDATTGEVLLVERERVARRVALAGPAVRVQLEGDVVLASLGSRGVRLIDWSTGRVTAEVHPQAVVTAAALHDELLAIAATTGLYLYDLRRGADTPIAFVPAAYGFLDVRFLGDDVVALDWRTLSRFRTRRDGHVAEVDAPMGYVVEPGQGLRVPVRNEGDVPLRVGGITVAPRSVGWLDSPPSASDWSLALGHGRSIVVARRTGRARVGAPLPIRAPGELASRRITFVQPDCALQFPAWKDLRWLLAHRTPGAPTPTPVATSPIDELVPDWASLWGLPEARPLSAYADGPSEPTFNAVFGVTLFLGGADVEAIYETDAAGVVTNFSHEYRSDLSLPPPVVLAPAREGR